MTPDLYHVFMLTYSNHNINLNPGLVAEQTLIIIMRSMYRFVRINCLPPSLYSASVRCAATLRCLICSESESSTQTQGKTTWNKSFPSSHNASQDFMDPGLWLSILQGKVQMSFNISKASLTSCRSSGLNKDLICSAMKPPECS